MNSSQQKCRKGAESFFSPGAFAPGSLERTRPTIPSGLRLEAPSSGNESVGSVLTAAKIAPDMARMIADSACGLVTWAMGEGKQPVNPPTSSGGRIITATNSCDLPLLKFPTCRNLGFLGIRTCQCC
jgi:hypothetical protein